MMTYNNPSEVMMGIYVKLHKKREGLRNKLAELTLQLRFLEKDHYMSGIYEKLEKDKRKAQSDLEDVDLQIEVIENRRNSGASLDPFLKEETETSDSVE
jgi:hypothetical protein